ncbi:hypothetical protein JW848_08845, partial [Candidatus Bipolaricaulota bacterium]|nr:hypothetical protein [Candidatus Bipolaricaulota bacterium]
MHPLRNSAVALLRDPSLLLVALGFTLVQYFTGLRAGILDIQSPWWILTMAVILLGSPVVHSWLIVRSQPLVQQQRATPRAALSQVVACFVRLLVSEILVNVLVVAGLVAFLAPGVYIGIRVIYYKQAIVLDQLPMSAAILRSVELTSGWRAAILIFVRLVPIWAISFGVVAVTTFFDLGFSGDVLTIVGSAVSLAWVNVFL